MRKGHSDRCSSFWFRASGFRCGSSVEMITIHLTPSRAASPAAQRSSCPCRSRSRGASSATSGGSRSGLLPRIDPRRPRRPPRRRRAGKWPPLRPLPAESRRPGPPWRELDGYSFSDLSPRGPRARFPHVYRYRLPLSPDRVPGRSHRRRTLDHSLSAAPVGSPVAPVGLSHIAPPPPATPSCSGSRPSQPARLDVDPCRDLRPSRRRDSRPSGGRAGGAEGTGVRRPGARGEPSGPLSVRCNLLCDSANRTVLVSATTSAPRDHPGRASTRRRRTRNGWSAPRGAPPG